MRLQLRLELEKEGGFSDVRGAVDEHGGTDTGFPFHADPEEGSQFLLATEELPLAERKLRPLAPQETHYGQSPNEVFIGTNVT